MAGSFCGRCVTFFPSPLLLLLLLLLFPDCIPPLRTRVIRRRQGEHLTTKTRPDIVGSGPFSSSSPF